MSLNASKDSATSSLTPQFSTMHDKQAKAVADTVQKKFPESTSGFQSPSGFGKTTKMETSFTKQNIPYNDRSSQSSESTALRQIPSEKYMYTFPMSYGKTAVNLNQSSSNFVRAEKQTPLSNMQTKPMTPELSYMETFVPLPLTLHSPINDGEEPADQPKINSPLADPIQGAGSLSASAKDLDMLKKASTSPEIFATWSNKDKFDAFMLDEAQLSDFTIAAGVKDTLPLMYSLMNKSLLASMGHQLDEMKATRSFNPFFLNCYTLEDKPVTTSESQSTSDLKLVLSTQRSEYLSISDTAGFVVSIDAMKDDAYPHLNGYIANSGSMLDISITQLMVIKNVGHCIDDENYSVDLVLGTQQDEANKIDNKYKEKDNA
uniref:Uncharacterized protein n=1 Tax=Romanomermis culicivorax TaxID=13658 RepID=A0A915L6L2_ROMCU